MKYDQHSSHLPPLAPTQNYKHYSLPPFLSPPHLHTDHFRPNPVSHQRDDMKEVKKFGIGLPKTGTKTLSCCFILFGYKHYSYNMELAAQVKKGDLKHTLEIADSFESFEDWPWFLIYQKLYERYPESKFILTTRKDTNTYIQSLKKHHDKQGIYDPSFQKPSWWDDVFGFSPQKWDYELSKAQYEKHIREVTDFFSDKPEKLLTVCWENGDGWKKLCDFLIEEVPSFKFPHSNKS